MASSAFPVGIYHALICTECANYVSVGPVVVSVDGSVICGRCPKPTNAKESLFNIIAQNYRFPCVNRRSGCKRVVYMTEIPAHQEACKYKRNYGCPLCYFTGNSCQLFYHFAKIHRNSIVKGNTLDDILSYSKLKNHVTSILHMTEDQLRLFINSAVKLFSICSCCKRQFRQGASVYICPEYHLLCNVCSTDRCPCKILYELNRKTELHILLGCEWNGCDAQINIFQYTSHKQMCSKRVYECPSEKCSYVGLLEGLKQHWHLNYLCSSGSIYILDKKTFFWIVPTVNEILYVSWEKKVIGNNKLTMITVADKSVLSPFSFYLGNNCANVNWSYKALSCVRYSKHSVTIEYLTARTNLTQ